MFYINNTNKNVLKLKCSFSSYVAVRNLLFNNLVFFLHKGNFILIHWKIYTWVQPPVFSGVLVTQYLVLYVCFVDRCLFFCTVSFGQLCCLFFFNIWILNIPLLSSNSSYNTTKIRENLFCFNIILLQYGPHCVDIRDYLREITFNYFERKFSNCIFLSVGVHHSTRIRYQSISNTLS